jgi:hypothetical protein
MAERKHGKGNMAEETWQRKHGREETWQRGNMAERKHGRGNMEEMLCLLDLSFRSVTHLLSEIL